MKGTLYTSKVLDLAPEPASSAHYIDADALLREFRRLNVVNAAAARLVISKIPSGESNPTFCVQAIDNNGRRDRVYILRKQPPGKLLPSAHDVAREFRILSYLFGLSKSTQQETCPVAEPIALLDSPESVAVIGAQSYVQAFIPGTVYRDAPLEDVHDPAQRSTIYFACMDALADLHATADPAVVQRVGRSSSAPSPRPINSTTHPTPLGAATLSAYTQRDYFSRMVARWSDQISRATAVPPPSSLIASKEKVQMALTQMRSLFDVTAAGGSTIVHGDFKLDNLIFTDVRPRVGVAAAAASTAHSFSSSTATVVGAVVDFELCTVGHPVADLAHFLLPWTVTAVGKTSKEDGALGVAMVGGGVKGLAGDGVSGIPPAAALVSRYCRRRGLFPPEAQRGGGFSDAVLLTAVAAEWFKMGGIAHGVQDRLVRGTASAAGGASAAKAAAAGAAVEFCAAQASAAVDRLLSSAVMAPRGGPGGTQLSSFAPHPFPPVADAPWAENILRMSDTDAAASLPHPAATFVQPSRRALVGRVLLMVRRFVEMYIAPTEGAVVAELQSGTSGAVFPTSNANFMQEEVVGGAAVRHGAASARSKALAEVVAKGASVAGVGPNAHSWHTSFGTASPTLSSLAQRAKAARLWNLFHPSLTPFGLNTVEYGIVAEATGHCPLAPLVMNCNAPDSGNMETLVLYGTPQQKEQWLVPLREGKIRSAFAMTEPDTASSDATNLLCRATYLRESKQWVINGDKWWISGAAMPSVGVYIVICATSGEDIEAATRDLAGTGRGSSPRGPSGKHAQHTVFIVPATAEGLEVIRPLRVFNTLDEPFGHCHVRFTSVTVGADSVVLGPGRGFEVAQGRLGPGRVHHCMRLVGLAERAHELALRRSVTRATFGRPLSQHGTAAAVLAEHRLAIDQARLLVLSCAQSIDVKGGVASRDAIAAIKIVCPRMAAKVIDTTIQMYGGGGVSNDDTPLTELYNHARTLRIADGPDDVHLRSLAGMLVRNYSSVRAGL